MKKVLKIFFANLAAVLAVLYCVNANPPPVQKSDTTQKTFEKVFKQNAVSTAVPVKAESQNNIVSTAQENRNKGAGIEFNSVGSHQAIDLNTELYESPPVNLSGNFAYQARGKI